MVTGKSWVGGLSGKNYGNVTDCYCMGTITGDTNIGGLCGNNLDGGSITTCYSTGTVNDTGGGAGGLCGMNYDSSITNCYSNSIVTGTGNYVGGLCGWNYYGSITTCYSTGTVNNTGTVTGGGLCGDNYYGLIQWSFWDIQTSGMTSSAGGEGKTTAEMKDINTFLDANWDFVDTWKMPDTQGYPLLNWQDDVDDQYDGGHGTQISPYQIRTARQLIYLANHTEDYSKHFILTADIDLTGYSFTAALIAMDIDPDRNWDGAAFTGTFNGDGHTISNLVIDGASYLGLFGYIDGGSVTNLTLENVDISGTGESVGGMCGKNDDGSITNCCSISTVTNTGRFTSGLCGWNRGHITNCYSAGVVTSNGYFVGGLCGANSSFITNCYSISTVANTDDYTGGLCGANEGQIINCYSAGAVTSSGDAVGGLCGGYSYSAFVSDSFWDIQTSGLTTSAGGDRKSVV